MANEFKIKKGLIVTGASGGTVVDIQGSQGQLFSVTDDLSGSIFAVSDISGVPILDVNSNGLVTVDGPFTQTGGGNSNFSGDVNIKSVFDFDTSTDLFSITNNQNTGGINLSGNNSRIYFGGNRAIEGAQSGTNLTFAEGYTTTYIQSNTVVQGNLEISATIPKLSFTDLQQDDWDIINDNGEFKFLCSTGTGVALQLDTDNSATFGTQAFATTATSSGDASSTLTTKGYVDGLITGATIYRGAWDPSGGGYGSPDLSGVTQTSGYYYICSAAGTAEPNGTGTEPDTWAVGDWVIYNDVSGTGQWQKIDNSSVLSGVGTGQTVALWEGAGSVTDSETLGNAPITVSGNDTTFGGNITTSGTNATVFADRFSGLGVGAVIGPNGAGTVFLRPSGVGSSTNQSSFTTTLATIGTDATFAGDVVINSAGDATSPILRLNNSSSNTFNHALEAINDNLTAAQTELLLFGKETNNRNSGFIGYNWNADNSETNYVTIGHWGYNHLLKIYPTGTATFVGAVTSPTFLGDLNGTINTATTGVTQTAGDNSTLIATTAYADAAAAAVPIGNYLPLAGGTMTGVTQFNDHTNYGDQVYARFGASQDLQIFHNGTDSFIDNYTGSLTIRNRQDDGNIVFTCDDGSGGLASYLTLNGNSTHAYFTNPGNVGIGTTNPSSKLHIKGSDPILLIQDDSTGTAQASSTLRLGESGAGGVLDVYWDIKQAADDLNTHLEINHSSNGNHLTILDNGNVGIGTTLPIGKFNVSKDSTTDGLSQAITVSSSSVNSKRMNLGYVPGSNYAFIDVINYAISNTNQALSLQPNGGNVGIGTTSPSHKLEVGLTSSVALASQPAIPLMISNNGNPVDGRVLLQVKHDTVNTAGAIAAGYQMTAAAVTSGTASYYDSLIFLESAGSNSETVHSAPKNIEFYVNNYNTAAGAGTSYTALGNLAFELQADGDAIFYDNVGIGTTSPGAKLDVVGSSGTSVVQSVRNPSTSWSQYALTRYGTEGADFRYMDFGYYRGSTEATRGLVIQSQANANLVTFLDSGNVGIGLTNPAVPLHVDGWARLNGSLQLDGSNRQIMAIDNTSLLLGTNNTEKMRITAAGNVGIGTTSPGAKLELYEVSGGAPTLLTLHQNAVDIVADDSMGSFIDFKSTDINPNFTPQARIGMLIRDSGGDSGVDSEGCGNLVFHTSRGTNSTGGGVDVERMRITDIGNVGIGTTTPNAKLDVQGTQGQLFSVTDDLSGDIFSVADISGVPIMNVNSDGTSYFDGRLRIEGPAPIATQPMLELHRTSPVVDYKDLNPAGYFSLKERFLNSGSTVIGSREVTQNPGGSGIYHNFDNGASGGSQFHQRQNSFHWKINSTSEKLTLGTNGYIGINDTSPSYQLDVNGSGRFTSTVTATNFILSSDERLKENVEKVCDNRVKADWKTFELKTDKGQKRYGVIAQELEKTNPEFVREDSQGFKSVAYIDLLIAKIAELEARLEKLEK